MPVVVLHSAVMTSVAARVAKACFHLASARAPHTWVAHCTLVALIALTVVTSYALVPQPNCPIHLQSGHTWAKYTIWIPMVVM